jgi:hypothetical protein
MKGFIRRKMNMGVILPYLGGFLKFFSQNADRQQTFFAHKFYFL